MDMTRNRHSHNARRTTVIAGILLAVWIPVVSFAGPQKAAIASAHPLATTAGMAMLDIGGNAFDAAVAVAATLAVVEPYGSGLGGGGFFLLHDERTGKDVVVDARETAPSRAVADMYQNNRREVVRDWATNGPLAAGIPGLPAGMVHVAARYGTLPLATTLQPAIQLARDGFPADDRYRQMTRVRLEVLRRFAETSNTFLLKGDVPSLGTLIRQPELAATLEMLVSEGHDGFYSGKLAQQLVEGVGESGGIWSLEDLAKYRVVEREPLVGTYRGARIVTMPPPSAGGVALLAMLNMLDSAGYSSASANVRDHMLVESMRRAFRDRAKYLGDPDFVSIPVGLLTSAPHAAAQMKNFDRARATASSSLGTPAATPPQGENTTHFSILDRAGNRVAATLSINLPFGCGFMVPGTGIVLNNEMDDFTAAPGTANEYGLFSSDANAIAPNKRPLSSMTPTFIEFNDRVAILGSPGGSRIPGMVLISTLALLDAAEPAQAVTIPRFHHQYLPDIVETEPEYFGSDRARQLRARGHIVQSTGRNYGNVQIVVWEKSSGRVTAASDPRGVGSAQIK
jgi:gamma-glutamyltranspeptidase/glutathione hydrolase